MEQQHIIERIFEVHECERVLIYRLSKLLARIRNKFARGEYEPEFYGVRRISSNCSKNSRDSLKRLRFSDDLDFQEITQYRPRQYHIKPYNYV